MKKNILLLLPKYYYITVILLFSCYTKNTNISKQNDNFEVSNNRDFEGIEVFVLGSPISDNYNIIEEIFVGPYGSHVCSYRSLLVRLKEKTIEMKCDAFKLIDVKYPTSGNPCYTAKALILRSNI